MEEKSKNDVQQSLLYDEVEECKVPEEVITEHILPWMPIKLLTQCKLMSKEWYSLISSPKFILNHFNLSLFSDNYYSPIQSLFIHSGNSYSIYSIKDADEDDGGLGELVMLNDADFRIGNHKVHLIGSGNGLICLAELHGLFFILWNPFMDVFHKFYPHDFELLLSSQSKLYCNWGFGYLSSLDDYKTVRIMLYWGFGYVLSTVHVYSLKSNRWKRVEFGIDDDVVSGNLGRPKVVNETIYWTIICKYTGVMKIIAFDLVLETFHKIPHLSMNSPHDFLCVLGGCLGICGTNSQYGLMITIYNKNRRKEASVRILSDAYEPIYDDLVGFTKTGKIIVARNSPRSLDLVADSTLNNYKSVVVFPGDEGVSMEAYVPSKVSPIPFGESPNASQNVPQQPIIVQFHPFLLDN